jgi:hypothetical protein
MWPQMFEQEGCLKEACGTALSRSHCQESFGVV